MKQVYYIAITRDENRDFLYSESIEPQEISKEDYSKYDAGKMPIIILRFPAEGKIIVMSRQKDYLECFLSGLALEQHKIEEWNEMYDEYIDSKNLS
jgi:hypothetical protein